MSKLQMEADVQEYTLWSVKSSIEGIANAAMNAMDPDSIEQGKDNLLGLARLILSSCDHHGIEVN